MILRILTSLHMGGTQIMEEPEEGQEEEAVDLDHQQVDVTIPLAAPAVKQHMLEAVRPPFIITLLPTLALLPLPPLTLLTP